jgi:Leucine Rich repeats (2 copies)/Leucine Rich Repeat
VAPSTGPPRPIPRISRALPPEIGQLIDLQTLDLSGNPLTALPPEIGQLTSLWGLDLSGNPLTALPPEIGRLTSLRDLWLDNNQLTTLPPELGRPLALGLRLSLDDNPLRGRIRKLSGRALGAYLRSLDSTGHQAATFDCWSSEDWRMLMITVGGSFAANIVTLLFVGLAVVFVHMSKTTKAYDEALVTDIKRSSAKSIAWSEMMIRGGVEPPTSAFQEGWILQACPLQAD